MVTNKSPWVIGMLSLLCVVLSACRSEHTPRQWEGQWHRTIAVPKGVQGRCVEEHLHIEKKVWQLRAILYPTFRCANPFLELVYAGTLDQVEIKKNTDNRQLSLFVEAVNLIEMADITAGERYVIGGSALKNMAAQYVPASYTSFRQSVSLSKDNKQMLSNMYIPLLNIAIAEYPNKSALLNYQRE